MLMKKNELTEGAVNGFSPRLGIGSTKHNPHSALKSAKIEGFTFQNPEESDPWVIKN
jgi:hypothetical protein